MSIQRLAMLFGVVFLAIGVLGFIPGITSNGRLLGIFEVNTLHNVIHLLSGVVAIAASKASASASFVFFKVFGIVYLLVAVVGFVQGTTVLGLFGVNLADNLLHTVIALASLVIGFGKKTAPAMAQPSQPQQ